MSFSIRRSFICAGVVGLMALGASTTVVAQTLNIIGPGGSLEDRLRKHVFPGFEAKYGVTIQYEASQTSETLAKLEASKSNQEYDVVSLTDLSLLLAEERGFCAPLEPDPVYDELISDAHMSPNSVGMSSVYAVIAIRTDIFEEKGLPEPESWLDLGNPAYKGEMALLSIASSTFGMHGLVMVARANGGGEDNIDPGMTFFAEKIRPNLVTVVQSASKLQEMLQTGEIGIGVTASSRAAALAAAGVPLKAIRPKEGVLPLMQSLCAVAGSAKADLAQKFLQYSSSVEGQQGFEAGETPVNKNAKHTPAAGEAGTGEFVSPLDLAVINANLDALIDRWNREVEY